MKRLVPVGPPLLPANAGGPSLAPYSGSKAGRSGTNRGALPLPPGRGESIERTDTGDSGPGFRTVVRNENNPNRAAGP